MVARAMAQNGARMNFSKEQSNGSSGVKLVVMALASLLAPSLVFVGTGAIVVGVIGGVYCAGTIAGIVVGADFVIVVAIIVGAVVVGLIFKDFVVVATRTYNQPNLPTGYCSQHRNTATNVTG